MIMFLLRYLHHADHNPRGVRKVDRISERKLRFKSTRFPNKIRDVHKIEEKNRIDNSVFGYENKE